MKYLQTFSSATVLVVFFCFTYPLSSGAATLSAPSNNLGLVGYWALNEGSGTKVTDYSGNGYTGTFTGNVLPAWISGKIGKALHFDNVNPNNNPTVVIPVPSGSKLSIQGDLTISMWIKPSSNYQAGAAQVILRGGTYADEAYLLAFNQNVNCVYFQWFDGADFPGVNGTFYTVPFDVWTHVVAVRSGLTLTFYINGKFSNTQPITAAASPISTEVSIGRTNIDGLNQDYTGAVDEVRIYNRAISAAEAASLYQAGQAVVASSVDLTKNTPLANGLTGLWTFDGADSAQRFIDRSGNGKDGYYFPYPPGTPTTTIIGKLGQAIKLNGGNVDVPNFTINSNQISVSFWFNTSDVTTTRRIIEHDWDYGGVFSTAVSSGYLNGCFNGTCSPQFSAPISPNKWYHVVMTYSGTTGTMYVNGIQQGSSINYGSALTNSTHMLYIGGRAYSFLGAIDDVRIYNRALTAAEVKQLSLVGQNIANAPTSALTSKSSLQSGLVSLWTFDGLDVTDQFVYDRVGGNNGRLGYVYWGGTAAQATSTMKTIGKFGQALHFNGMFTPGIDVGSSPTLTPSHFTITAWVNPDSDAFQGSQQYYNFIYSNSRDCCGSYNGINLFLYSGYPGGSIWNSTSYGLSTTQPIPTKKWTHIGFSYDGQYMKMYVNGALDGYSPQAQSVDPGTPATYNTCVGSLGNGDCGAYTFKGKIDDVRVYNRALSDAEMKQLYNMGK